MYSKGAAIKWRLPTVSSDRLKGFFLQVSGGKTVVALRRAGALAGGSLVLFAVAMAWFGPAEDRTFYVQTTQRQTREEEDQEASIATVSAPVGALFASSERKKESEQRQELERSRKRVSIKYYAPQLIEAKNKAPKAIRSGSKLVGFLLSTIDTRSPSPVRVRISHGGESNGIEIQKGSVLTGQYSVGGSDGRVFVSFSRLDTPDGEAQRIQAQALDSGTYTAGISGELRSDAGLKSAASLGLTMFAGMADVLTEKESLGFAQNGVQAKPTMRNALLQGLSRSAEEQTGRMAAEINSAKDYVVVPEGKELIIELTEDFR